MRQGSWKQLALIVLALSVIVGLFAPQAAADEARLVVQVDEPFEVNGTIYPAGTLTLRQMASFTPSTTLNEVCVQSECLGMLLASPSSEVIDRAEDSFLFERARLGHLVLVGFAYRGGTAHDFYRFSPTDGGHWLAPDEQPEEGTLLAASVP